MASRVQLSGPQEAEKYVLHMVSVLKVLTSGFLFLKAVGVHYGKNGVLKKWIFQINQLHSGLFPYSHIS